MSAASDGSEDFNAQLDSDQSDRFDFDQFA